LARQLGIDLCAAVPPPRGFSLVYTAERLELRAPPERVPAPVAVDLVADLGRSGRNLLVRALAVLGRIELRVGDALSLIPTLPLADVILLDPMFPERGKSALKDKGMRALRALVGDDLDASALLTLARRYVGRRVVVKRPLGAEPLAGPAPSGAIRGTTVRYDIYPPQR
jgi:16S rRNA (guanine1516-N2)-methyltransferase